MSVLIKRAATHCVCIDQNPISGDVRLIFAGEITPSRARKSAKALGILLRVVKNDAKRVAHTRTHSAHTVTNVHTIITFRPLRRTIAGGEDHDLTLPSRYSFSL